MTGISWKKITSAALAAILGFNAVLFMPGSTAAKTKKFTVKTKSMTLYQGAAAGYGSKKIKVSVRPKNTKVIYSTSNKKVASVNKKGTIKAKKAGTATISVKAGGQKNTIRVTVKKIQKKAKKISAPQSLTVEVNSSVKANATVKPKKATLKQLVYRSKDKGIAAVNRKNGTVTGIAAGSTTIIAKTVDGSNKKISIPVTVTDSGIKTQSLTVSIKKKTLYLGAEKKYSTVQLKPTVVPDNAPISYKSKNPAVATVSETGLVTAAGAGKTNIVLQSGTKNATVKITVKPITVKVTKVTAAKTLTVAAGSTAQIVAKVKPTNATLQKLSYTSKNKAVAKVTQKGVVTGITDGNAKVVVKAMDGSKKKATVAVTVTSAAVTAATAPAISTPAAIATEPAAVLPAYTQVSTDKNTQTAINISDLTPTLVSFHGGEILVNTQTPALLASITEKLFDSSVVNVADNFLEAEMKNKIYGNIVINKKSGSDIAEITLSQDGKTVTYSLTLFEKDEDEEIIEFKLENKTQNETSISFLAEDEDARDGYTSYYLSEVTINGTSLSGNYHLLAGNPELSKTLLLMPDNLNSKKQASISFSADQNVLTYDFPDILRNLLGISERAAG